MGDRSSHNILQYMQLVLDARPETVTSLGRLVSDLASVFATLGAPDSRWGRRFQEIWAALEETYAFELGRGLDEIDAESSRIVSAAISELRTLMIAPCLEDDPMDEGSG